MLLKGKLVSELVNIFPKRCRDDVCKYMFLIGFDKAIKKGLIISKDTSELKKYASKEMVECLINILPFSKD